MTRNTLARTAAIALLFPALTATGAPVGQYPANPFVIEMAVTAPA